MHILSLVFNNFKNDSRVLKECTSLLKDGHDVTVIALHEDDLPEEEVVRGIHVHRIRLKTRKYSKSLPMQMIKFVELGLAVIKRYRSKVDAIHCNDILPLPLAVMMKKLSRGRIKIVYDAHEYQTETQKLKGKTFRKKLIYRLERLLIKQVEQVITVSNGIAEEYQRLYGITKPALVLNCPYYTPPSPQNRFRERFGLPADQKILLYQGALTEGRGLLKLIEGFTALHREDLALVIMGYGYLQKKIEALADEHPHVYYHPAVPPQDVLLYTSSADIGVSLIENSCLNYYYCLPNKLFEYAMAGLPVIVSHLPEMKQVVETYHCGVVAQDTTVEAFKEAIEKLMRVRTEELKQHALEMAKVYNWENQEKTLIDIYHQLQHPIVVN